MKLADHAERELRLAGFFYPDSDYDGMLGEAVMELVKTFAAQGHSRHSAYRTLDLFGRVASYGTLMPLKNPMETKEYLEVCDEPHILQSTRKSTLFSHDGGRRWHDIDKKVPRWKRLFGVKLGYVTFAK